MEFESEQKAYEELRKYAILIGHYYEPSDKQIKDLFVATNDPNLMPMIYAGIRETHPRISFNSNDLKNIMFWARLDIETFIPLHELLKENELKEIAAKGYRESIELDFDDDWSEPIQLYRGFAIRLTYNQQPFTLKLFDEVTGIKTEGIIPENWFDSITIKLQDQNYRLGEMKKPKINFKSNSFKPVNIRIDYLDN